MAQLVSAKAVRTVNPIRRIVENMKPPQCSDRELISLSLGDPCAHGNLRAPAFLSELVARAALSGASDGYCHSAGAPAARAAVAAAYSTAASPLCADDVFITSGCSGALELVFGALLDPGDNVLVPQPGFPLYKVVAESLGAEVRHYRLLPDRDWEVDLEHMASLIDGDTRAILVNNPSNPCGSVYSEEHLRAILALAAARRLPLISDEIYGALAFPGAPRAFTPLAALPARAPLITLGGLAKQCLVPGWRCGWALAALPEVLGAARREQLRAFHLDYAAFLEGNARFLVRRLAAVPGLSCSAPPQGAMFVMIRIDPAQLPGVADDVAFAEALLREEAVAVLPGLAFGTPLHVRLVFCAPRERLATAAARIEAFCRRCRCAGAAAGGATAAAAADPAAAASTGRGDAA
ncbi:tyrosine transaminase [Tribonema minus]|uniref:Tyrosine transaminase n=1 Tax=Tribonema minus TaxID=303371 RepID=A0A836CHD8_9STRA|nr:tyrosine transaminase [Tribonema minus]